MSRTDSPRRAGSDRGAIIPLTAMMITIVVLSAAFAVDLGRLGAERRSVQADADVIALDLVRLANGRTTDEILASVDYGTTRARSAAANDIPVADLQIQYGLFDPVTASFNPTAGAQVPNAVRVTANAEIGFHFAQVVGTSSGQTSRNALAALSAVADLSIGSRVAELRSGDADRLNFLLKNRLGGPDFNVSGAGYQGLASSNVTYEDIAAAGGFGSPDEMIDSEITLSEYAEASAYAFAANGEPNNATIAFDLAERSRERDIQLGQPNRKVKLRDIMGVDVGGPPQWASATANFFDLFIAAAEVANGKNLTDVCTSVPGWNDGFAEVPRDAIDFDPVTAILQPSATTCTSTIEAPQWIINGRPGAFAETAQLRVAQTGEGNLSISGLTGRAVVPAILTAGGARADLQAIRCHRDSGDHRTDTLVTPQPMTAQIGTPGPEFKMVDALGLVRISVDIDKTVVPSSDPAQLIVDQVIDTVERGPGSTPTLGFRLTKDDVKVLVEVGTLSPLAVSDLLNRLVPRLNVLLSQIDRRSTRYLDAFGIGVNGSDLFLDDVRCDDPLLVG